MFFSPLWIRKNQILEKRKKEFSEFGDIDFERVHC